MSKHQGNNGNSWRGLVGGYEPEVPLNIASELSLFESDFTSDSLNPVTYEVIRHRLWTINEEHGQLLENMTGSPIVAYIKDFNPTILTARGEIVFSGPYLQFFSATAELQIKWILENRSSNPGIQSGDIFLANDPWIGNGHQSDVHFCKPIFYQNELICWITNTLHQYDLGGVDPGSMCFSADDVFDEPTPIPPIKIVEGDSVRQDVRDLYLRQSRVPEKVELDLNGQISGLRESADLIKKLFREYNPGKVLATFEKIIEESESTFLDKIGGVSDGTWRTRSWHIGEEFGDFTIFPVKLQLVKEGNNLIFKDEGTEKSAGTMNTTFAGFRAAIASVINPIMLSDAMWVTSGAFRHIDIDIDSGTINRAEWPSSMTSGTMNLFRTIEMIQDLVIRMVYTSEETRKDIIAGSTLSHQSTQLPGVDQWGEPLGTTVSHFPGGGIGARYHQDGIDTGGLLHSPLPLVANVEDNENDYPILYLYGKETQDTMGHGNHRGGTGLTMAFKLHGTDEIEVLLDGHGFIRPHASGMAANPPAPWRTKVAKDTDIETMINDRNLPDSIAEFRSTKIFPPKSRFNLKNNDVIEKRQTSAAGIGDPIRRDPSAVRNDVESGYISKNTASEVYGVVLTDSNLDIDELETKKRRQEIRMNRIEESYIPAQKDKNENT